MVLQRFFDGTFLRLVLAESLSCFSDMDFSICFEAPLRLDFGRFSAFRSQCGAGGHLLFFRSGWHTSISLADVASAGSGHDASE